jgi:polar amino acid transport system substrate-binding protein
MKRSTFGSALASLGLAVTVPLPGRAQQVLRAGTNVGGSPWSFHDPATNSERGLSIDIINAFGKDAGYDIQFVPMPTIAALIPALLANTIDVIAANMLITPERQAAIAFSIPIYPGNDGLVVLKSDARAYLTLADVQGMNLGTQAGSPYIARIQKTGLFPDLKIYPTGPDTMQALVEGHISAGIVGAIGAAYEIHLGHYSSVRLVNSYQPLFKSNEAVGVRKADGALLEQLNTSLTKFEGNGVMKDIFSNYGIAWVAP